MPRWENNQNFLLTKYAFRINPLVEMSMKASAIYDSSPNPHASSVKINSKTLQQKPIIMKTILQKVACSLLVLPALLLGAKQAQGAPLVVSNFESPTYMSGNAVALAGQDGWTGVGTVTPDTGSGYTLVLAGGQSTWTNGKNAKKSFISANATASDIYELSWLQASPDALGANATHGLYLNTTVGGSTPAGIFGREVGGNVTIFLSGNTEVDTGVTYLSGGGGAPTLNNIYKFTMQFDFGASTMTGFYSLNGGSSTSLGNVTISNTLNATDVAANYGVLLYADGGVVGFDNIELTAVPEPSTVAMALLGLGSLTLLRRSHRKSASA